MAMPAAAVQDEVGYYCVEGMAIMSAQAAPAPFHLRLTSTPAKKAKKMTGGRKRKSFARAKRKKTLSSRPRGKTRFARLSKRRMAASQ